MSGFREQAHLDFQKRSRQGNDGHDVDDIFHPSKAYNSTSLLFNVNIEVPLPSARFLQWIRNLYPEGRNFELQPFGSPAPGELGRHAMQQDLSRSKGDHLEVLEIMNGAVDPPGIAIVEWRHIPWFCIAQMEQIQYNISTFPYLELLDCLWKKLTAREDWNWSFLSDPQVQPLTRSVRKKTLYQGRLCNYLKWI